MWRNRSSTFLGNKVVADLEAWFPGRGTDFAEVKQPASSATHTFVVNHSSGKLGKTESTAVAGWLRPNSWVTVASHDDRPAALWYRE